MPHGQKILGDAGKSLADIYDVEGSVVHIDELEARAPQAVHEMGATILSERIGSSIDVLRSGDINQSSDILVTGALQYTGIHRILNIFVFANAAGRVADVSIALVQGGGARQVPIYMWETTGGTEYTARILNPDGGLGGYTVLQPDVMYPAGTPAMLFGSGQRTQVGSLNMNGTTTGFGAGTVEVIAVFQVAGADVTGTGTGTPSNYGLPIPSW